MHTSNHLRACVLIAALLAIRCAPEKSGEARSYTVDERIEQFGAAVERRVGHELEAAGVEYPPHELAYVAFKDTDLLEVHARDEGETQWRYVMHYPILAASGVRGPKLREGDRQVPEGFYRVAVLNPNSRFHLSIGLDYPNEHDRAIAEQEGREGPLGGDIMIHGNAVSIGCLAMGDTAAEDLFILAALAGAEDVRIIVSPTDFRRGVPRYDEKRAWVRRLYDSIAVALRAFPASRRSGPDTTRTN